ncbi:e3 ubiquitin-protein ligase [Gigaspora margarita]|uniref:E3 ubiquitin-protein ligase n=1 Tax=Gigaspora margarita TaxID=4874 RepID=A0A8H4ELG2_GIGMA|nr:e3 ubiquitin-protein ligase [Gigaspora margarita]
MLILGKVAEFLTYINDHNPIDNENYWSLIKELASASDLLDFLQTITEHDIKNLINGVDDFSDERLIQEDTVSSLIQVKQNISNRGEGTKEKIQNALLIETYTFEKVDKSDKFNVMLVYQAKGADKIKHNMTDLQDLRGRALLIAKPANMNANLTEEEESSKIMNEFVLQVDTAQEILNVGSKLIQMGHFDYRRFKKEIIGTDGTIEMRNLLAKFKKTYNSGNTKDLLKGERIIADVVDRGKLCVSSCNDKLRVPNIIMSLYANHGSYPEPWQVLICTKSTKIEVLNIFIKRCFFAAKDGYRKKLFYQFSQDVHLTNGLNAETMKTIYRDLCSNVVCVSSDLSGQGKTEWIKQTSFEKKKLLRSFLISDGADF